MTKEKKISKEVALEDLGTFINKFVKKPVEHNELEETYPDILEGIMDGLVNFNSDGVPVYTLKFPIKAETGEVIYSEINFRTRIKPTTLADLAKGLHPQKEVFTLQLRMTSYIIDKSVIDLDKFERYDYDVINQIASVFS